jgi:hypothetical protein
MLTSVHDIIFFVYNKPTLLHMLKVLTTTSAGAHQALAIMVICIYCAVSLLSLVRHGERSYCHNLDLRAVSLLRDAARNSLRADNPTSTPIDRYVDAAHANIYVKAVTCLLTPEKVARYGISVDKLRTYTEKQVDNAYGTLVNSEDPAGVSKHQRAPKRSLNLLAAVTHST